MLDALKNGKTQAMTDELKNLCVFFTLIYMGYFDNLFYMGGGGAEKPPSLTLAVDF